MDTEAIKQFKQIWELGEKEPTIKKIERKTKEIDFSLCTVLDRFVPCAEKAMASGKIDKSDYEELINLIGKLKKLLGKIKDKEILTAEIEVQKNRRSLYA